MNVLPDCGGVLAQFDDGALLRFRYQIGHAFSRESLLAQHTAMTDWALWAAFNALNEQEHLLQRLAQDAKAQGDDTGARRFTNLFDQAEQQKLPDNYRADCAAQNHQTTL